MSMPNQASKKEKVTRKNIFVDIDETLMHAELDLGSYDPETPAVQVHTQEPNETYLSALRPGAIMLLFNLRTVGHVYALTRATHDYALAMNKAQGFGFPEERIYSRKHVKDWRYSKIDLDIPQGQNYLIDDLNFEDNYEKIALLRKLGPVQYIKVKPFWGHIEDGFTHEGIAKIVDQTVNTGSKGSEDTK
jgi:hypothetical protein